MRRWHQALALAIGLVFVVSACGSDDTDASGGASGSDADTVTIGMVASLSGNLAIYGVTLRDAAQMAVDEINDAGGIDVAGKNYTLDLQVSDDRSEQAGAVQAATELITDAGAIAIWGPIGASGPGVAEVAKQGSVLNFQSSSAVINMAGSPDYPLMFMTLPTTARITSSVNAIREFVPDAEKVALVAPDDQVAAQNAPGFTDAFDEAGMTLDTYLYPVGTTDLSSLLTRLEDDNPDVIVSGFTTAANDLHVAQFDAAGVSEDLPVLLFPEGISRCESLLPGRPCIAQPVLGADLTSPAASAETKAFVTRFLDFIGEDELPVGISQVSPSYDFIHHFAAALSEAGTVSDVEKIADTLRSGLTTDGLPGEIAYDEDNHVTFGLEVSYIDADGNVTTKQFH